MLPEIFVLSAACLILMVDVYVSERYRFVAYEMAQATLIGAAVLTLSLSTGKPVVVLGGHFVTDMKLSMR